MDGPILIVGCFDTKGEIFNYLRNCLIELGSKVVTINTGVLGSTHLFPVDYEADLVCMEAGHTIAELREAHDRGRAVEIMSVGAAKLVAKLHKKGVINGIIAMGGGGGTYIALSAMQSIPFGIPKVCVTTLATKDLTRQVGTKDIVLFPSVVDVAGLNSILLILVRQAAAAIFAMSKIIPEKSAAKTKIVAISMFGNTTQCVDKCTQLLNMHGYEVMAFHATGAGGIAMESLILEGLFDAVLDITTTEIADYIGNGICNAGPNRLTAAAQMGIPQVIAPGCLDMVNFGHPDTIPAHYKNRQFYSWAPDVTLMRTNETENALIAENVSQKLNVSHGPVAILLPLQGVSEVDRPGGVFYNPQYNQILFDTLKSTLSEKVYIEEVNSNINDPIFAEKLVEQLLSII